MVTKEEVKKLVHRLLHVNQTTIEWGGSVISVEAVDQADLFSLSTVVYGGGNYIPPSVRNCIAGPPPYTRVSIDSFLTVEEDQFKIFLNHHSR